MRLLTSVHKIKISDDCCQCGYYHPYIAECGCFLANLALLDGGLVTELEVVSDEGDSETTTVRPKGEPFPAKREGMNFSIDIGPIDRSIYGNFAIAKLKVQSAATSVAT